MDLLFLFFKAVVYLLALFVILPMVVYVTVKMATMAVLKGRKAFEQSEKENGEK